MAAATSTGPISIEQINTTFYVWGGGAGFDTIQAAVDFIRVNNSGVGEIQVVHGHGYGEDIATLTGGDLGMIIIDNRDGHDQRWNWNGTNFAPAYFMQLAGFVAEGMPQQLGASILMGFSPTGDFGNGSGNLIVTADPTKGMPSFNLTLDPQDGTGLLTFLRAALNPAGSPRIQMPEALEIYKNTAYPDTYSLWTGQGTDFAGSKGMYVWAKPTENAIDFQGQTIGGAYDQTIRLNYLGGDIFLGANASVGEDGTLTAADVTADSITAGAAVFDTCLVDESPVRTFANTADGPSQGMIWPTIGIPVSAGDHWQDPSIDPTTLATWPTIGIPVSAGDHWQDPSIDPTTLATWPAAGIPVSTGTTWGTPINPADVPHLSTSNIFTRQLSIEAPNATTSLWIGQPSATGAKSLAVTANATTNNIVFQGASEGIGFDQAISLNPQGGSVLINNVIINPASLATWPATGIPVSTGTAWGTPINPADVPRLSSSSSTFTGTVTASLVNAWSATGANVFSVGQSSSVTNPVQVLISVNPAGGAGGLGAGTIDAVHQGVTLCDLFLQTSGGNVNIGSAGRATTVQGDFAVAGAKSFIIPHPLDDTKDLIHSCLEGPENGVYYRGEVVTANGEAQVTLPDYFEALTFPEDRSVLLTQIYEDDSDLFSMLMATRVKDGKFKIRSTAPVVKVWWEVKAVRKINVDTLEVERLRFIPQPKPPEESEDDQHRPQPVTSGDASGRPNAGTVRTGASEAGEPKPEKVRAGGSGPGSSNRTRKPH